MCAVQFLAENYSHVAYHPGKLQAPPTVHVQQLEKQQSKLCTQCPFVIMTNKWKYVSLPTSLYLLPVYIFLLPLLYIDTMSSVRLQGWRFWMILRFWWRRESRLKKPTGYSRAVSAAGRGRWIQQWRKTHTCRKSPALSLGERMYKARDIGLSP